MKRTQLEVIACLFVFLWYLAYSDEDDGPLGTTTPHAVIFYPHSLTHSLTAIPCHAMPYHTIPYHTMPCFHSFISCDRAYCNVVGKAYIITTKASIPPTVRQVAVALGFQPVQIAAILPYRELYASKQAFCQACFYTDPPGK